MSPGSNLLSLNVPKISHPYLCPVNRTLCIIRISTSSRILLCTEYKRIIYKLLCRRTWKFCYCNRRSRLVNIVYSYKMSSFNMSKNEKISRSCFTLCIRRIAIIHYNSSTITLNRKTSIIILIRSRKEITTRILCKCILNSKCPCLVCIKQL